MHALDGCLNSTATYEYNQQRGINNYFGPYEQLMCVRINNSPDTGNYLLSNETLLNRNEEIQNIVSDPNKMGFVGSVFKAPQSGANLPSYTVGDKMKSFVGSTSLKQQYLNGFPLPKADSFGICDNFKSAHFMLDD